MKVGDKAWIWSPLAYKNIGKIEQGEVAEISEDQVWLRLSCRKTPYSFFRDEVFPTREALCEHYRKIFE